MSPPVKVNNDAPPGRPVATGDVSTLGSGAGIVLAGRLTGRAVQVVCEVVLARFLGPAAFGLYATGWALLRVVGLIAPLGLDKGVVRYAARLADDPAGMKDLVRRSLGGVLAIGVVLGLVFYLAAGFLAVRVFGKPDLAPVLRAFAPAFAPFVGLRVAAALTRTTVRMRYSVLAEDLAPALANLVLIAIVYRLGLGLVGAAFACSVAFALAGALALFWVVRLFPMVVDPRVSPRQSATGLLRFSLETSLAGVAVLVLMWIDRLLLAQLRTATEVGVYQAATQPAFLFSTILVSFNAVLLPMIARLAHADDSRRMEELYRVSTRWGLYLSLPPFLVLCFAPEALLEAVFGVGYVTGATAMVVLASGQLVNAGTGAVGALLIMNGRQRAWLAVTCTFLVLGVGLHLWWIPRYGILGAAAASAVAIAGLFVSGLILVRKRLGLWPYDLRYAKGFAAAGVAAAALYGAGRIDWGGPVAILASHGAVAGLAFVAVLWLLGADPEDRELLRVLRKRLAEARG